MTSPYLYLIFAYDDVHLEMSQENKQTFLKSKEKYLRSPKKEITYTKGLEGTMLFGGQPVVFRGLSVVTFI